MKKSIIVVNKRKLYGRKKALFNTVVSKLTRLGHHLEIHSISSDMDSKRILPEIELDQSIQQLIIAGGDGFINLILQSWQRSDIPFAIIPLGTCNLFATECGYTKNSDDIVDIISKRAARPFYCGTANNYPFSITASCGVDSFAASRINHRLKKIFGRIYMVYILFSTVIKKRANLTLSMDGASPIEISGIFIAKGSCYAGRFCIAPQATIFEPTLHILYYKKNSIWHEIKLILSVFCNRFYKAKGVCLAQAKSVLITATASQPVQVDGDVRTQTSALFSLDKQPRQIYAAPVATPYHLDTIKMDKIYGWQVKFYDVLRKYYLRGRDRMLQSLALGDERILEIGCGTGRNLITMCELYPEASLWGIDVSHRMLNYAQRKIKAAQLQERIHISNGNAKNIDSSQLLPQDANGFDRIIFSYTLSMIRDYKEALVSAIKNIKSGGKLHIIDFSNHSGMNRITRHLHQLWLSLFNVHYEPGIASFLKQQEANGLGDYHIEFSPKHYYEIITFKKK